MSITSAMNYREITNVIINDNEIDIILEYFPKGVVAFDLEMTGLSAIIDQIIEIAAIKINADRTIEYFHELINPLIPIPEDTIQYHQITNDMVRDKRALKKPLREFCVFFSNLPLIAHNAQYDASFIINGMHRFNYALSLSDIYDSCKFSRNFYKRFDSDKKPVDAKLDTLANYFGFSFEHHKAIDDAIICLKVFAKLLFLMKEKEFKNLKELCFLYKLSSFKKAEDYLLPKKFELLKEYLGKDEKIYIYYKGRNGQDYRPIKAKALIPMPQGLVLYAECLNSQMRKNFLIKKIKKVKLDITGNNNE